jgi:hypothetical protein
MTEKCQKCDDESDELRTLFMSCGYDMNELEMPFEEYIIRIADTNDSIKFFTLIVCKECQSNLLAMIQAWFHIDMKTPPCGSGIYIRRFGANIEVSEAEFKKMYPGIEPIRVKGNNE